MVVTSSCDNVVILWQYYPRVAAVTRIFYNRGREWSVVVLWGSWKYSSLTSLQDEYWTWNWYFMRSQNFKTNPHSGVWVSDCCCWWQMLLESSRTSHHCQHSTLHHNQGRLKMKNILTTRRLVLPRFCCLLLFALVKLDFHWMEKINF